MVAVPCRLARASLPPPAADRAILAASVFGARFRGTVCGALKAAMVSEPSWTVLVEAEILCCYHRIHPGLSTSTSSATRCCGMPTL